MPIVRVNATADPFQRHGRAVFKLVDAIGPFGKCHLVRIGAPRKAAAQTQPLGCCQEALFAAQFVLSTLLILNVGLEYVPSDNAAFPVAKRKAASAKPSVDSVEATEACFKISGNACCEVLREGVTHTGKILMIHDIVYGAQLHNLRRIAYMISLQPNDPF